jgi:phytoene synthase
LRDLRLNAVAGRLPFPLDALDAAGIVPADLQGQRLTPSVEGFLEAQRLRIDRALQDAMQAFPPRQRAVQRQGLVLGALYRALIARIAHRGELARSPAEVPPLQRVWTAWRTAMSAR